jgi:UDP-N-acetylglucosamine 2-epimerase
LEPLKVFDVKDNTLYILVPDEQMGLNYITKKYTLPIKVAVAEIIGKDYEIEFVLPEQAKSMRTPKPMAFVNTESIDKSSLNPNYTFDTFVVGNTVIDALYLGLDIIKTKNENVFFEKFSNIDFNKKIILITCHRRENFGEPFEEICKAILEIANKNKDVEIVFPVHLNPNIQKNAHNLLIAKNIKLIAECLSNIKNITISEVAKKTTDNVCKVFNIM